MMFYMTGVDNIWRSLDVPCDPEGLEEALENVSNWFPDEVQFAACLNHEKRPSRDARLERANEAEAWTMGLLHYACAVPVSAADADGAVGAAPAEEQERRARCVDRLLRAGVGPVNATIAHVTRTAGGPGCVARRGGLTPLHVWACTLGEHSVPVLRSLVDAGADASLADDGGDAPLHTLAHSAAHMGDEAAVEARLDLLLRAGASLDARDAHGRTALDCAALAGDDAAAVASALRKRAAAA